MTDLASLELGPRDALFLDFDGTLTEIIADPDAARLPEATTADLARLVGRLGGALALLSGRDVRDLAARSPDWIWRAGGHGIEIIPPGAPAPETPPPPPPEAVLAPLRAAAAHPGARLEIKGPVVALHYRAAPEAEAACRAAATLAAAGAPGFVAQAGKMVVEVKPATAHKGRALRHLMTLRPFADRRPVMLGDDTTDEDAIEAAQALGGLGVKIGEGRSAARLRAASPAAVRAWLAAAAR